MFETPSPYNHIPYPTRVSVRRPDWKVAGITLSLATIPPASAADVTLPDDSVIRAGNQFLRYGQILTRITTPGPSSGKFGPYDPNATDGRQNLNRGECFILDRTWLATPWGPTAPPSNEIMGGVFDSGEVCKDHILQSGALTHSLVAGPNWPEFLAAFPLVRFFDPPPSGFF